MARSCRTREGEKERGKERVRAREKGGANTVGAAYKVISKGPKKGRVVREIEQRVAERERGG